MADSDSALGCSNISIMQLFHELKQKFPAVPDRVVSECIRQNAHDKDACEAILRLLIIHHVHAPKNAKRNHGMQPTYTRYLTNLKANLTTYLYSQCLHFEGRTKALEKARKILLLQQLERKNKLQRELCKEKENLRAMQREVQEMRKDLEQRQRRKQTLSLPLVSTVLQRVQELKVEISRLQDECKKMTQEVDLSMDARVPLGETDEEFYKNIYTGQRFILPSSSQPPPQRPDPGPGPPGRGEPAEGPHWTCSQCTFRNHPLLDKCETCEMPRIML
ncbi:hypothetical protein L9F63_010072, partial [Diploptera punctata]